jgi:4-amino-4-deoxy-L-arabinose transferase-like glycosyltransferase
MSEETHLNAGKGIEASKWGQVCLLLLVGLFSFTYNLQISLFEGTEGLYGQVARELVQSGEYVRLTFQGQAYFNKPPLFFWMIGGFTQLFGDNEVALRLTAALSSLGTMVLIFVLGKTLFSWNVGFWAAFIFATNHLFLWYGRRVLIDSTLTFFMTLALLGWVFANRKDSSPAWPLVTFLGMALATMVKGLHGFVLPFLLIMTYSILVRNFRPLKQWGFWVGLMLFVIGLKISVSTLGLSAKFQYSWTSILFQLSHWSSFSSTAGSFKVPSYLYLIWFDLLPWSVLIPSSLMFLFSLRPLKKHPGVLFILLWFLGYFLVMCLSRYKREPYLMPLVPGFALTIGYYLVALTSRIGIPPWHRMVNGAAFGLLTVTIMAAAFFGTPLLQKKWNVPADFLPAWYLMGFVILGGFLIWTALKGQYHLMRRGLLGIGLCFAFGMIHIFLPVMDAAGSPRIVNLKVREIAANSPPSLYHYGLTQEDIIYYLNVDPPIPRLHTYDQLTTKAKKQNVLIVTDKEDGQALMESQDLVFRVLEEFPQPRGRKFLLLSVGEESPET